MKKNSIPAVFLCGALLFLASCMSGQRAAEQAVFGAASRMLGGASHRKAAGPPPLHHAVAQGDAVVMATGMTDAPEARRRATRANECEVV